MLKSMSGLSIALFVLLACVRQEDSDVPPPPAAHRVAPMAAPAPDSLDYTAAVEAIKDRLPHDGFTVLIEPPFVVVGDESAAVVKSRAARTVRWAVKHLKSAYFKKDPDRVLSIWLFKDKKSYESNTWSIFKDRPGTPFGYYSSADDALIMNIETGGGTLVHEIVHPFIEANFPSCPSWFNEGLGSLYEQSRERDGKIMGSTNWRLRGLKDAIRAGKVPSFESLFATSRAEFYDDDPGTNYAQSRYLLYYLQEKGLLRRYYREFFHGRVQDPTGTKTMKRVLGEDDLVAFKPRWEKWVLTLRF